MKLTVTPAFKSPYRLQPQVKVTPQYAARPHFAGKQNAKENAEDKGVVIGFGMASLAMLIAAGITSLYLPTAPEKNASAEAIKAFEQKQAFHSGALTEDLIAATAFAATAGLGTLATKGKTKTPEKPTS